MPTKSDHVVIAKIATKFLQTVPGTGRDVLDVSMDLEAAAEHCEIDWAGMLDGRTIDLCHDVAGIIRNLNRQTKRLENCFSPRWAK